jgi:hypothetical protein
MPDIRKLYPASSALGGTHSNPTEPKPPDYFLIHFRSGDTLSYSYRFVSGVETVGQQRVDVFCNCRNIVRISIFGNNLAGIASDLRANILRELRETTHPAYVRTEEPVIERIEIKRTLPQG